MSDRRWQALKEAPDSHHSQRINTHISIQSQINPEDPFNQRNIFQHYARLKDHQHQQLAQSNLSEQLKKKLFDFSEGYFFKNNVDPYKMVIENHPIKGRIVMKERKYLEYCRDKEKEFETRKEDANFSNGGHKGDGSAGELSDLSGDLHLPYDLHHERLSGKVLSNGSGKVLSNGSGKALSDGSGRRVEDSLKNLAEQRK